jgi:MFS-type transporter involved in bile tolerance (Atg22 family)
MRRSPLQEVIDVGIGAAAFFAFVFLVVTIAQEVTGRNALGQALILLLLVLGIVVLLRLRRREAARAALREEERQAEDARGEAG